MASKSRPGRQNNQALGRWLMWLSPRDRIWSLVFLLDRGSTTAFRLDATPTFNAVSTRPGPPTRTDTALRGGSVSDQCRRPDRLDALTGRTRDLDTIAVFRLDIEHLPVQQTHFDVDRVAADLDGIEHPI
jgi:hypothetical protein